MGTVDFHLSHWKHSLVSIKNMGSSNYSEAESRNKNVDEYNATADKYEAWCKTNSLMQNYCYYSTFAELEKEGIEGKTFLEVGCGPCPIGQRLAKKGVKKVYGLDISSGMIEAASRELSDLGIRDKFELICHDIFDETFLLPEKVDCVVLSYTLTTFISNYDMLAAILKRCAAQLKPDGYMFIADFCWVKQREDQEFGMHTACPTNEENGPEEFGIFHFFIDTAPGEAFEIFHIPNHVMFKAAYQSAKFDHIEHKPQYPDPAFRNNDKIRSYLDECNPSDYLMKFKFSPEVKP